MLFFQSAWASDVDRQIILDNLLEQCNNAGYEVSCKVFTLNTEGEPNNVLSSGFGRWIALSCEQMYLEIGDEIYTDYRLMPNDSFKWGFWHRHPSTFPMFTTVDVSHEDSGVLVLSDLSGVYTPIIEQIVSYDGVPVEFTFVAPDRLKPARRCDYYSSKLDHFYQEYLVSDEFPVVDGCVGFYLSFDGKIQIPFDKDIQLNTHRVSEIISDSDHGWVGDTRFILDVRDPQNGEEIEHNPFVAVLENGVTEFISVRNFKDEDFVVVVPYNDEQIPNFPEAGIEKIISDFQDQFSSQITDPAIREKVEQYISAVFTALDEAGFTPELEIAVDENGKVLVKINMVIQRGCNQVEKARTEAKVIRIIANIVKAVSRILSKQ